MAKKAREEPESEVNAEPAEAEVAACALVVELLRSGRILTYIGDILVERVDEADFPGESEEAVVIRRFCELVVPVLAGQEQPEAIWKTARLIESVRGQVVADFQLELDSEDRRS
ncbi:MAG: hypothetical protein KDB48_06925 [Solirubrobacterales bacterium]|nr:hypothetical protein [Solirubrobacterales bacterium]HMT06042.1 hypothetical protein [Solirubrobacterales bacterium]